MYIFKAHLTNLKFASQSLTGARASIFFTWHRPAPPIVTHSMSMMSKADGFENEQQSLKMCWI